MTVDEQDPAVVRLRRESGSVRVSPSGVDTVLRRVHERRKVQRQHRVQAFAALSVVLVAVAGALFAQRGWEPEAVVPLSVAPLAEWPLRGSLAEDRDLLVRAERTWRQSPHRPSGAVRALYAGAPRYSGTANFAVVAMASDEGSVAFVTTPVQDKIDTSTLLLRALGRIEPGQPAIGFIAARPDPRDERAGVAFGLAAPGVPGLRLRSSAIDFELGGLPSAPDGAAWVQVRAEVGAWNSTFDAGAHGSAAPAAGVLDPATGPVVVHQTDRGLTAEGATPGDLIVTDEGVLGVAASSGLVDTRLSALGQVEVALSEVTGTITDAGEFLTDGEVNPTNRVVMVRGDVTINVGVIAADGAGWRVERAVPPSKVPTAARRVTPP